MWRSLRSLKWHLPLSENMPPRRSLPIPTIFPCFVVQTATSINDADSTGTVHVQGLGPKLGVVTAVAKPNCFHMAFVTFCKVLAITRQFCERRGTSHGELCFEPEHDLPTFQPKERCEVAKGATVSGLAATWLLRCVHVHVAVWILWCWGLDCGYYVAITKSEKRSGSFCLEDGWAYNINPGGYLVSHTCFDHQCCVGHLTKRKIVGRHDMLNLSIPVHCTTCMGK